MNKLIQLV